MDHLTTLIQNVIYDNLGPRYQYQIRWHLVWLPCSKIQKPLTLGFMQPNIGRPMYNCTSQYGIWKCFTKQRIQTGWPYRRRTARKQRYSRQLNARDSVRATAHAHEAIRVRRHSMDRPERSIRITPRRRYRIHGLAPSISLRTPRRVDKI